MKIFVIISCIIFLVVALYADTIWGQYLVGVKIHTEYAEGINTIPIIALAYVCLGIYYNLTVWYKLTDKTIYGAYITLSGAIITIILNYITIPVFGYWGSAWVTLACYAFMMFISYRQGQKHYRIPYAWKKLTAYVVISIVLYIIYFGIRNITENMWVGLSTASLLLLLFLWFIGTVEKSEISRLPFVGKFYKIPPVAIAPQSAENSKA